MNIAVIIAGGVGSRLKSSIPKQFLTVSEKPIIIHTLEKFENCNHIDEILVVVLDKWQNVLKAYADEYNINKLKNIVAGGNSNQDSIANAVSFLYENYDKDDIIIIHAANRPLVSEAIIKDSICVCKKFGNAVSSTKCIEVAFVSENHELVDYEIDREKLYRTQTPQTFYLKDLNEVYRIAKKTGITDCGTASSLHLTLGKNVYLSQGSSLNFKITTQEDLVLFKALDSYMRGKNNDKI